MNTKTLATAPLKPALASIRDSCKYLGGISRAKFYSDILPELQSVRLGTRHFIVVASMDRFVAARLNEKCVLSGMNQSQG